MSIWQKSLTWLTVLLILPSICRPCSGAMLTELTRQPNILFSGTPRSDSEKPALKLGTSTDNIHNSGISADDLAKLSSHDVVLIIDKSHSMSKTDCYSNASASGLTAEHSEKQSNPLVSRWQWCHEQTLDLAKKMQGALPSGITVVLFSGEVVAYNNVNATDIETIFSANIPRGSTNTALALKSQLGQYFERRNRLGDGAKPLLIAVITDGCPTEPSSLRYAIIDATKQMKTQAEISITFLQVGNDVNGSKILTELDQKLIEQKAKFDIVDVKPFAEVSNSGLANVLVSLAQK
jgi:Mg-chelatase subunit ChlD